jgi:hypothetical protein
MVMVYLNTSCGINDITLSLLTPKGLYGGSFVYFDGTGSDLLSGSIGAVSSCSLSHSMFVKKGWLVICL